MLRFASETEALQHLANITGKKIKIAKEADQELVEEIRQEFAKSDVSGDELEKFVKRNIEQLAEENVFTVKDYKEYWDRIEAQEDEKEQRKEWYN